MSPEEITNQKWKIWVIYLFICSGAFAVTGVQLLVSPPRTFNENHVPALETTAQTYPDPDAEKVPDLIVCLNRMVNGSVILKTFRIEI
jgi:hypothetical protein